MGSCPTKDSMKKKTNTSRQGTRGRVSYGHRPWSTLRFANLGCTVSTMAIRPCEHLD
ncbi:hypothetical protein HanIR_Chr10g0475171 [Helianthus annuus]|nr:hypothetical protein HanIR_Chr10g0475171 [Helianthus annuus]